MIDIAFFFMFMPPFGLRNSRGRIISMLFLCNYWQEFNRTLWEPSIPRGDGHILALLLSDPSSQSYGP
jgi:hypothetical protein